MPHLRQQMRRCDVIILVYAADRPETFSGVSSYWLPLIENSGCTVPVVLVGNKIDARRQPISNAELQRRITPILQQFKFVEAYDECTAKMLPRKVHAVFYLAQKAVMYPLKPLFDVDTASLTTEFRTALERVFRVYDQDRDGVLSDTELNDFQRECFEVTLETHHIADLKKKLCREMPEGAVCSKGILLPGFFFLNKLFLERNRPESTWVVLRKFNYDDHLQLLFPGEQVVVDRHVEQLAMDDSMGYHEQYHEHEAHRPDDTLPSGFKRTPFVWAKSVDPPSYIPNCDIQDSWIIERIPGLRHRELEGSVFDVLHHVRPNHVYVHASQPFYFL